MGPRHSEAGKLREAGKQHFVRGEESMATVDRAAAQPGDYAKELEQMVAFNGLTKECWVRKVG